jgi:hypothetical protein
MPQVTDRPWIFSFKLSMLPARHPSSVRNLDTVPFPLTDELAAARGDPRQSIDSRYRDLLDQDVETCITIAAERYDEILRYTQDATAAAPPLPRRRKSVSGFGRAQGLAVDAGRGAPQANHSARFRRNARFDARDVRTRTRPRP